MTTKQAAKDSIKGSDTTQANNLFISVKTFNVEGKTVGERTVDLYHFGTRKWLQEHNWWAMHHQHTLEINNATPDEVNDYTAEQKRLLAEKFNSAPTTPAAPAEEPVAKAA